MRTLGSTPMLERENRERYSERVTAVTSKLETADVAMAHGGSGSRFGGMMGGGGGGGGDGGAAKEEGGMTKPTQGGVGLATEVAEGQITQLAKNVLFA